MTTTRSHHDNVEKQFGSQASAYLSSAVHASGRDLVRLGERLAAFPQAHVLDLGCGAGHASFTAAQQVAQWRSKTLAANSAVQKARSESDFATAYDIVEKQLRPDNLHVTENISIVAAVGRKMAFRPGTSGRIFAALGEHGINIRMISQGPDELNIIVGVDTKDFAPAIQVLYNSFVK